MTWLLGLLIIGGVFAAYSNSFTGSFVGLDAKESIRDNPHIRHLWPLSEAMSLPLVEGTLSADEGSKGGTVVRRPILSLSFALDYHFFGLNAHGYHAVNLLIHALAALVLFGLLRQTLNLPALRGCHGNRAVWLALAVALLWAVHPLQTESVTYIVQRAESLMGLLLLLTVYCAARGLQSPHPRAWYAASVIACAVGMGTKETMSIAPVLVLLYDIVFVSGSLRQALRRRWGLYAVLASTWAIAGVLVLMTLADASRDFGEGAIPAYLLAQPRVILHYVRLALWPHPLYMYVNTPRFVFIPGRTSPLQVAVPAALIAAALLATGWAFARRHWLGFVGAWFFVILAPTSSIVATSDVIQEHRMYLPLAAVITLVVVGGDALLRRPSIHLSARQIGTIGAVLVSALAVGLGLLTYDRNRDYGGEFSMIHPADLAETYEILADHELTKSSLHEVERQADATLHSATDPAEVAYAHYLLGVAYERHEQLDQAVAHLQQVVALQPHLGPVYTELGAALSQQGQQTEAERAFRRAIDLRPDRAEAYVELGTLLVGQGNLPAAREQFTTALRLRPTSADAHSELGALLLREGRLDEAEAHLRRAVEVQPTLISAHEGLGRLSMRRGNLDDAARHFQRAHEIDEDYPEPHFDLGILFREQGQLDRALAEFETAIQLRPEYAEAHYERGRTLLAQGHPAQAVDAFEKATRFAPDLAEAYCELGVALRRQGDTRRAAEWLEKALAVSPDLAEAHAQLGDLLLEQHQLSRAADHLEQALSIDPASVEALNSLMTVYLRQHRFSDAETRLQEVARRLPESDENRKRLAAARALIAQGERGRKQ
jgi:protein O-mannosyl-transferase